MRNLFLFITALLLSVCAFAQNDNGSLMGDVNNDGSVSVTDITIVISHILGQTPDGFNKDAADINGDESISVTDVTMIISIILNGDTSTEERPFAYIGAGTEVIHVITNANRTLNYGSGNLTYNVPVTSGDRIFIIMPENVTYSAIMGGQPMWLSQAETAQTTTIDGITYKIIRYSYHSIQQVQKHSL